MAVVVADEAEASGLMRRDEVACRPEGVGIRFGLPDCGAVDACHDLWRWRVVASARAPLGCCLLRTRKVESHAHFLRCSEDACLHADPQVALLLRASAARCPVLHGLQS